MIKISVLIIVIPFILIAAFLLFLFILSDYKSAQKYKHASRSRGKVKKQLEKYCINAYGSGLIGKRRRIYHQYEVEYLVDGKKCVGILQTKEKKLNEGDIVEVRYNWKEGMSEPQIATSIYADRIKELAMGGILGIILAIGIMIYFYISSL